MYDIITVGGGPAGLTAALYGLRANKSVLVIEKSVFGGQITFSPQVENIPGFYKLSGNEFAEHLVDQVLNQGAEFEIGTVLSVEKSDDGFTVTTEDNKFSAKSVIIATGAKHRLLGVSGEEELIGNGISFCAVCDGAFFKDKSVAVIGGGNSALQEALLLSELCSKVTVIQNLLYLTGEGKLCEQIEAKDNIEVILNSVVTEVKGTDELEAIVIRDESTNEEQLLQFDGMFVAIGLIPQNEPFQNVLSLDESGYAKSGENCLTAVDGIFVAGDCRTKSIRQVVTAASDGAIAALAACNYIDNL